MPTDRSLVGMPLVVRQTRIGRVLDAAISEDRSHLEGLWIDAGLLGTRFIPADELRMLGQSAVLADSAGIRRHYRPSPLLCRAVGTDGSRLGIITGAEIDALTFRVTALELSFGFWDDLLRGRVRVESFTSDRQNGGVIARLPPDGKEEEDEEQSD